MEFGLFMEFPAPDGYTDQRPSSRASLWWTKRKAWAWIRRAASSAE